jgi:molybdenum cofactor synthesis domain-containing protein
MSNENNNGDIMTKNNIVTAAFVMIGDEILSGRTEDKNLNFLAQRLTEIGISLKEVRVVPDDENEIIAAIKAVKDKYNYIFTSGGIGPTHDDITSLSIAKAFDDELVQNQEATEILIQHYGAENVNEARLKMAFVPKTAKLLNNPVSSAPGFRISNVFVMAGVPKIFQAMFEAAKIELVGGKKVQSKEIKISLTESIVAKDLEDLQKKYIQVSMGSYPFEGGTSLVFRSNDYDNLEKSVQEMAEVLERIKSGSIINITNS